MSSFHIAKSPVHHISISPSHHIITPSSYHHIMISSYHRFISLHHHINISSYQRIIISAYHHSTSPYHDTIISAYHQIIISSDHQIIISSYPKSKRHFSKNFHKRPGIYMIKGGYNEVNPGTVALILLKVAGVLLDRFAPLLGRSGSFRTVFGSFWIVS